LDERKTGEEGERTASGRKIALYRERVQMSHPWALSEEKTREPRV
jgi:hypothetical protein